MNGIEILNQNEVCTIQPWVVWVGILAFVGAIVFTIILSYSEGGAALSAILCICLIICVITFMASVFCIAYIDCLTEYDYTEHKVTIDDSVSMNEFLDKYEILDQEGKIYTVKERE